MVSSVETLIALCADLCGGQSALARKLGVSRKKVSDWKVGRLPLPVPTLADLADMADLSGEEARLVLADAECRSPKHQPMADRLRAVFFGFCLVGATCAGVLMPVTDAVAGFTLYTLCAVIVTLHLMDTRGTPGYARKPNNPGPNSRSFRGLRLRRPLCPASP